MKKFLILFLLIFLQLPLSGFSWDRTGHQLVAIIAYDNLTPTARRQIDHLIHQFDQFYPASNSFLKAAPWMDIIRSDDVNAFNDWHFINLPFSPDSSRLPSINPENVVWAIQQSQQVLRSPNANAFEKALFLRFLIHLVADVHQPLHCVTRVTKQNPYGDEGGTLYPITAINADNLHEYWDEGAGYFAKNYKNYPLHNKQIRKLANQIEATYPESYFGDHIQDINAADWANESFTIAKSFAYDVPIHANLVSEYSEYTARAQQIASQRIALAGYRLAYLLNAIFGGN